MADAELTAHGSYVTPDGPGRYTEWRVEDMAGGLDCQVYERGRGPEMVRGYHLAWGTDLDEDLFLAVAAGDHWLGGNPDVRLYTERPGTLDRVETTWTDYRHFHDPVAMPAAPDAVELVNGDPPERYLVSWDTDNEVDDRGAHEIGMTLNPARDDLQPDGEIADHVGMYLRATRGADPAETITALLDAMATGYGGELPE